MMKVGIVGLGMLGNAVALHLLDEGYDLTVYNRTKEKTIDVERKGAKVVATPKEVAKNSDLIITIVKDVYAIKQISVGSDGIIEGAHQRTIVADMSTISPNESREISSIFQEHGISKLDIPVMGGPNV
ncbi:MAG: NAD(P)-dependent oxidoreductase, partial [Nitrosopumilus sp.]|nr:NAD(P)-dependent oxidoreductase [Nitrosopumilus sp.]